MTYSEPNSIWVVVSNGLPIYISFCMKNGKNGISLKNDGQLADLT